SGTWERRRNRTNTSCPVTAVGAVIHFCLQVFGYRPRWGRWPGRSLQWPHPASLHPRAWPVCFRRRAVADDLWWGRGAGVRSWESPMKGQAKEGQVLPSANSPTEGWAHGAWHAPALNHRCDRLSAIGAHFRKCLELFLGVARQQDAVFAAFELIERHGYVLGTHAQEAACPDQQIKRASI